MPRVRKRFLVLVAMAVVALTTGGVVAAQHQVPLHSPPVSHGPLVGHAGFEQNAIPAGAIGGLSTPIPGPHCGTTTMGSVTVRWPQACAAKANSTTTTASSAPVVTVVVEQGACTPTQQQMDSAVESAKSFAALHDTHEVTVQVSCFHPHPHPHPQAKP